MLRAFLICLLAVAVPTSAHALTALGPTGPDDVEYLGEQLVWTDYSDYGAEVVMIDPATGSEAALFKTRDRSAVLRLAAGGGRVFVEQQRFSHSNDSSTTVIYDATLSDERPRRVASATYFEAFDCGTMLSLLGVDTTGRAIVAKTERSRANSSEECVGPDGAADRSAITRFESDGPGVDLVTSKSKVRGEIFRKHPAEGSVAGNFLITEATRSVQRLDLLSGALTTIKPQAKDYIFMSADVASDGQMVVTETRLAKGAFANSRAVAIDLAGNRKQLGSVKVGWQEAQYCGDRIAELKLQIGREGPTSKLILHDGQTSAKTVVASLKHPTYISSFDCTAAQMTYTSSWRDRKAKLVKLQLP